LPNGLNGIKQIIDYFHRHGIRVLFPIQPWDMGTRDQRHDWSVFMPKTMAELNADGLNGDTLEFLNKECFDNSIANKHPLVLEPELSFYKKSLKSVEWNLIS
jgi:hypothetical protein